MVHDITIRPNEGNTLSIAFYTPDNMDSVQWAADKFRDIGRQEWVVDPAPQNITTLNIHDADLTRADVELVDEQTPESIAHTFVIYANLEDVVISWVPYINAFNEAFSIEVTHNGPIEETRLLPSFS